MMKILINPVTPFICFAFAMIWFKKENVSFSEALFFFLRRAAFVFKPKLKDIFDIFTREGIYLIILGYLLAIAYVLDLFGS